MYALQIQSKQLLQAKLKSRSKLVLGSSHGLGESLSSGSSFVSLSDVDSLSVSSLGSSNIDVSGSSYVEDVVLSGAAPPIIAIDRPSVDSKTLVVGGWCPSPSLSGKAFVYIDDDSASLYSYDSDDYTQIDDDDTPLSTTDDINTTSLLSDVGDNLAAVFSDEKNEPQCDENGDENEGGQHGMNMRKRKKVVYEKEDSEAESDEDTESDEDVKMGEELSVSSHGSAAAADDDVSIDPTDLAALEKLWKKSLRLSTLSRKDKELMEGVFSPETLKYWNEERGVYYKGRGAAQHCAAPGGVQPFFEQALHIIKQVASGYDHEKEKLIIKQGVQIPVLKFLVLLCGTDNDDGSTDQMMGLISEDDDIWITPTGRVAILFDDSLPDIENDIDYGNQRKFMILEVRTNCQRKNDKNGKMLVPKHCLGTQKKEAYQFNDMVCEFISAFPDSTKKYFISGGGQGNEPIFREMDVCVENIRSYWHGASHLSQYSSPATFIREQTKKDMIKMTHYAQQLSMIVEFFGKEMVEYCLSIGVNAVEAEYTILDVFWGSSNACMVGDPEVKAMWNDVLARFKEMNSTGGKKGGSRKTPKKAAAAKQSGWKGKQMKLVKEAKEGRGKDFVDIQVYYAACKCGGESCPHDKKSFVTRHKTGRYIQALCDGNLHNGWRQTHQLPVKVRVIWKRVSTLPENTDKICGEGTPGLWTKTKGSYAKYGCGSKACGEWKSNYEPETAYFCEKCQVLLDEGGDNEEDSSDDNEEDSSDDNEEDSSDDNEEDSSDDSK